MSAKFELVKRYYDSGLWSADRVRAAVGRWITQEECNIILGANDGCITGECPEGPGGVNG